MAGRAFFVGIDDTDFGESIGTGALGREVQIRLADLFGAGALGITRHQFLVHPDIPYTSHNSAACVAVRCGAELDAVAAACEQLMMSLRHEGADPGLCVRVEGELTPEALAFARRAQAEVVRKEEAIEIARREGAHLRELGGAGIGVIGAFAACALRMSGDDGRFLSLGAIREFKGDATAGEIMRRCPIERVVDENGADVGGDALIKTNGWVRPILSGGRVILVVKRNGAGYFIENRKRQEEG